MSRLFIFAQQVNEILKSGKKEIQIPEGARLSAAAADLIKEHKLSVKNVAPSAISSAAPISEVQPVKKTTESQTSVKANAESKSPQTDPGGEVGNEISEEMLEDLVNRVVIRFKQLKGNAPAEATPKKKQSLAPQQSPADDDDLIICRCEEITKGAIRDAIRNGMQTLNGVKRVTRAGMGLCQGQTCQRLVSQILAEELGIAVAEVEPITARGPVRPLRLSVFANS
jgi:bacterioferritin-associated ferredoxin